MEQQFINIAGIPAILWGPPAEKIYIAVHGDQSHKGDDVIAILAEEAVRKDYQVISFDLPEHGERKTEARLCKVQNCIEDLTAIYNFIADNYSDIRLFGCSLGAYFGMMAFRDDDISQALFLSPVVDMKRIIQNMMMWFQISEEQLQEEQEITTPIKTLYWDYYRYVADNPVHWDKPTALLYGAKDELCEYEYVRAFADKWEADMTVSDHGEHFFHTPEQLSLFRSWLREKMVSFSIPCPKK